MDSSGFTPEQFDALLKAMQEGVAREKVPDKPPAYATGADARIFADAARREVEREVAKFLTKEQIQVVIGEMLTQRLNRIGLKTDEEHIDETGEVIRRTIRWQKKLDTVFGGIIFTGLGALVVALLKLIGINVPWLGPGNH